MIAGCSIKLSTPPKLSANVNSLVFSKNLVIELDDSGLEARGESYNVSYLLQKDSNVLDTWHGRYLDLYEKREVEWRIIERVCVHEFTMSEAVSAMEMDASKFRQGAFDRPANSRPIGP